MRNKKKPEDIDKNLRPFAYASLTSKRLAKAATSYGIRTRVIAMKKQYPNLTRWRKQNKKEVPCPTEGGIGLG